MKNLISLEEAKYFIEYCPNTGSFKNKVSRGSRARKSGFVGHIDKGGYRVAYLNGRIYRLHRLVWFLSYGEWPENDIDHINGIRLDNRLFNLRSVSRQENMKNTKRPITNTSGIIGVSFHKLRQKWRATIQVNRKHIHLGLFNSFEEASIKRKEAEFKFKFHENHGR